jgi:peptidyl-tRNA hydrolase, PTH2 family
MATKQVVVWRHDLQCRLGKKMAQAGHAVMAFLSNKIRATIHPTPHAQLLDAKPFFASIYLSQAEVDYLSGNFRKVVLRVDGENDLMVIYNRAKELGLTVELIEDSGLTEFDGPTKTCLAIGPDEDEKIDQVTGDAGPLGKLKPL